MLESVNKNKFYTKLLQEEVGCKIDGVVGPNTVNACEKTWGSSVISHNGKLVPIDFHGKINHEYSLFELPDGTQNWRPRTKNIDNIVVHWGGLHALHCYQIFFNTSQRHVSSHFLIGRNVKSGELEVLQCLDTGLVAYHGGKINGQSVGIDICQSPEVKHFNKTLEYYPNAEIIKNSTSRGPSEIVDIDPELAEFAARFIDALEHALDLQHKERLHSDEVLSINELKNYSVLGHHNVSLKKWDVLPYADRLYPKKSSSYV